MLVTISTAGPKALVSIDGKTELLFKGILKMGCAMVKGFGYLEKKATKANTSTTRSAVRVYLNGKMGIPTKESTLMI